MGQLVGKKAEPKAEELEFIYSKIEEGLSDSEIIDEMQGESFLLRSIGFFKRRRREYGAAKSIFEGLIGRKLDPAVIRQRIRHWNDLATTAKSIVRNIEAVKHSSGELSGNILLGSVSSPVGFDPYHKKDLDRVDTLVGEGLLGHLKNEFEDFRSIRSWRLLTKQGIQNRITREMLKNLSIVSRRRTLRGSCNICQAWDEPRKTVPEKENIEENQNTLKWR